MNLKNFKNYILENNLTLLNEGVAELKDQCWSNLNIDSAFQALAFSPDWSADVKLGSIEFVFNIFKNLSDEQKKNITIDNIIEYITTIEQKIFKPYFYKYNLNNNLQINNKKIIDSNNFKLKLLDLDICPYITIQNNDKKLLKQVKNKIENFEPIKDLLPKLQLSQNGLKIPCIFSENNIYKTVSSDIIEKIFQLYKAIEDKNVLKDCKTEEDVNNKLTEIYNSDISDEMKQELNSYININNNGISIKIDGYFDLVRYLYILFKLVEKNISITNYKNIDINIKNEIKKIYNNFDDNYFQQLCDKPNILTQLDMPKLSQSAQDEFKSFYDLFVSTGAVTDLQRQTLKLINELFNAITDTDKNNIQKSITIDTEKLSDTNLSDAEKQQYLDNIELNQLRLEKKQLTPENFVEYLFTNNVSSKIISYNNERNRIIQQAKDSLKEKKKKDPNFKNQEKAKDTEYVNDYCKKHNILPPLSEVKSIIDLNFIAKKIADKKNEDSENDVNDEPNLSNPCAARRMKLFEKVQKLAGATPVVFKSKNWVVSVTTTQAQQLVFGRNRPKIDNNNNIINECNLDDDEGITASNKKIRDGSSPCIKDGYYVDGYQTETGWCTAAAYNATNNRWNHMEGGATSYYLPGLKNGLIQIMDCRDGCLYQLGQNCGELTILDERDRTTHLLADPRLEGTRSSKRFDKLREIYPELHLLVKNNGLDKYIYTKDSNQQIQNNPSEIRRVLLNNKKLTSNGGVIVSSPNDLSFILPIISEFSEIIIKPVHGTPTSRLFEHLYVPNSQGIIYPPINLYYVKDATSLFRKIQVDRNNGSLILKNTENIQVADSMFEYAEIGNSIIGLDTSNVTSAINMFFSMQNYTYKMVSIPKLNLKKCKRIDNMFTNSAVPSINIENIDNIESARNAFVNCFMLEKMPNVKFKKINNINSLVTDVIRSTNLISDNIHEIFNGCPKLHVTQNYDNQIEDLINFYTLQFNNINIDERNFLIIKNSDDVDIYINVMKNYNGIVIDKNCEISNLFYKKEIIVKTIDFNGLTNVNDMFYACNFKQIRSFIGTENITNAFRLFSYCTFITIPPMKLPNLNTELNVFYNCNCPRQIPNIEYGKHIKIFKNYPVSDVGQNNYNSIVNLMLGGNASSWISLHGAERICNYMYVYPLNKAKEIATANIVVDENGYIIVDNIDDFNLYISKINTKHKVDENKEITIKGFKLSDAFVEKCNQNPESDATFIKFQYIFNSSVKNIPNLDLNGLRYATEMFSDLNIDSIGEIIGTDKLCSTYMMFQNSNIKTINAFDVSNVNDASSMFVDATINNINGEFKFKNIENARSMFAGSRISDILLNTKFIFDIHNIIYNCVGMYEGSKIKNIGKNIIDNILLYAEDTFAMFEGCTEITDIPITLKFNNIQSMSKMFYNCKSLKYVHGIIINNSNFSGCSELFNGCDKLDSVGQFEINNINNENLVNITHLFNGCKNLKYILSMKIPSNCYSDSCFTNCDLRYIYGENCQYLKSMLAVN